MMVDYVDDGSKRLVFSSIRVILTEREREREREISRTTTSFE